MPHCYPVSEIIGNKIRSLRKEQGLSLISVAQKIGISEQQQLRYERGINRISIDRLKQYSDFFGINIISFFSFSDKDKDRIKRYITKNHF
ncbi:helix-turn-helix domain-containing protein [Providencia rettgeri]|uniref:helix-turn-helix domain-containing protein n=1 Tax=Providencia rettgeri TaxID=587 RepID=UPI0023AB34D8|nr:helix-turn-helix transcriptional regulator [Providencia rettgeri]ELR5150608.1 helix-turn-helix transcriptional regulator [Providencia rettgeri]